MTTNTNDQNKKHVEVLKNYRDDYATSFLPGLTEALSVAIEALEGERWIPVSERLPENEIGYASSGGRIICAVGYDVFHDVFFQDGSFWTWDGQGDREKILGVTHWMPLPEGPK
jgi:hypothetical protein